MVRFRVMVYGYGFRVGLDRTNSKKKSKKVGNLHVASFYVIYHLGKITNTGYESFSHKSFVEMSFEVQRCMAFDSNEIGYGLQHSIVCRNEAIFRTLVYLGCRTVLNKGFRVFF